MKYSEMTRAEKRVAIAKDVIKQLKVKKFVAESGSYIDYFNLSGIKETDDIKKSFSKIKKCRVCAMGACLLSITKFENKLTWGDVGSDITDLNNDKVKGLFKKLFHPKQLLLIETAFEGDFDYGDRVGKKLFHERITPNQGAKCNKFKKSHLTDSLLMIAIMQNIIKNKGTFKL